MVTLGTRLSTSTAVLRLPRAVVVHPHALAILALITANMIWAGSAVASKAVLMHVPPLTMATLRVAIALVVLRLMLMRKHERPASGGAPALLGLTGVALFCACQNLGLLFAEATTTALLAGAIPVLTAGFAVPVLGERLSGPRLAGLLLALAGVSVIVLGTSGQATGAAAIDNLLPLASAICFALYAVLGRRAFGQGRALAVVAGSTQYGLLCLLPVTLLELAIKGVGSLTIQDGVLLLYLGAGCSALAFLLCGYGLTHLEAGHGAIYGNIKPLVGVALAVVLLGEPLTITQIGGGLLVLVGVGLASSGQGLSRKSYQEKQRRLRGGRLPSTTPTPSVSP